MILFPEELLYKDYEGRTIDLVQAFIKDEFVPFPVCVHDDMLDGLSRIKDLRIVFPKPDDKASYEIPERDGVNF